MDHSRRECLVFLKRMGKEPQTDHVVPAFEGVGKYGKGGKWGKGTGKSGKGKGYYGGKGYKGYRAPGKAVGKGLNYSAEDDYTSAWGIEADYYYNYGGAMNYMGNAMMMLERNRQE